MLGYPGALGEEEASQSASHSEAFGHAAEAHHGSHDMVFVADQLELLQIPSYGIPPFDAPSYDEYCRSSSEHTATVLPSQTFANDSLAGSSAHTWFAPSPSVERVSLASQLLSVPTIDALQDTLPVSSQHADQVRKFLIPDAEQSPIVQQGSRISDEVPQSPYSARTQLRAERRRVLFTCGGRKMQGIALHNVLRGDMQCLDDADDRSILEGFGDKVSYRIEWKGYPSFSAQKNCTRTKRGEIFPITRAEIVRQVARVTQKFIDHNSLVEPAEEEWRVGTGHIELDSLVLMGVDIVSRGSLQPIYRTRAHIASRGARALRFYDLLSCHRGSANITKKRQSDIIIGGFGASARELVVANLTLSSPLTMAPAAAIALGPGLIGTFMNVMLYGTMGLQCCRYFNTYENDGRGIKVLVAVLLFADTVNTAFDMVWIYDVLINHFTDVSALARANWVFATDPALVGIIATICQLFFAWRVKTLTGNILDGPSGGLSAFSYETRFADAWDGTSASLQDWLSEHGQDDPQDNKTHLVFNLPLAKLYTNSLMSTLNTRDLRFNHISLPNVKANTSTVENSTTSSTKVAARRLSRPLAFAPLSVEDVNDAKTDADWSSRGAALQERSDVAIIV
ncbi:hypothetical protein NM688_g836 [Phlebia brevispora]|uniref:Uncharacterized protein n=1 Tax=Phlebia brevispora TaxID=194682 RepID=A0ACC1TD78_9APHY|nr:hypothetical protein NM688_g836 [Phlebia brevispora]